MKNFSYSVLPSSEDTQKALKSYNLFFQKIENFLEQQFIKDEHGYNRILKQLLPLTPLLQTPQRTSSLFKAELTSIQKGKPLTEPTAWGGVTLKKVDVEKDYIQKLLIIKKKSVLGFEIHKEKHEHLTVIEGFCIVFFINHDKKSPTKILVQLAGPKDEFIFKPNDEHGILTLSNCIIKETSTNHLDDLVYIFNAKLK
ncbi:MAG TPA: hypothetical protein VFQ63_00895 [Patescibacteria group bacterium]|nr:hypothetical protein [Patescibacteria group bacterium]